MTTHQTPGRDAVIVGAVRTPVGRRNGALSGIAAGEVSAQVLRALADRTGIDPAVVDDVIWGCVSQVGEQTGNIARHAVLSAGWPEDVPGTTVDRQCGSSQQALHFAAAGVISGQYDVAVAGGVEMMSRVPMGASRGVDVGDPMTESERERYGVKHFHQGLGAEMIAERWSLSRSQIDEFSAGSHHRAARAIQAGEFAEEIVPVALPDGTTVDTDGGVRPDTTAEKLAGLKPAFAADGVITAGSSSQISDGSAALLITTSERARALGLASWARIHTAVLAGSDPVMMLTAPIPATAKALDRAGLAISDIGTFEVNEAFAPVVLAWLKETGAVEPATNPSGGAIALGHPLGASGARLMTTMVHRMRREGIRFGLQTMCEGGGMANATIIELL
ncbi:thiolase family protein [Mycolicibacter hiberniae]|uniref:Acetyl-CoA acyltransferase n=1 Tax=Mycolicibacter hiberniae TaxID=29314 RepID=A0A7I7WXV5_9MYCO|nr:acetyl-CoA C-acyltransferase [Mycolicibacter hiberniae]MCV7087035.1 acetyl-CoA C-acyltransferase [Mycolicibacter hiberniae]ORV67942.1 acetyl-CoA acetyltransferase [Mycolicibacter hiberniae]BBZ21665.1 acetyl-CoA acyltransferase [Mycolicibacter hiberniae]